LRIPIGAVIVSAFSIVWVAAGARSLGWRWLATLLFAAVLVSSGLIYAGGHIQPSHPQTFNAKPYTIAVAAEVVLIFLSVVILRRMNRKHLVFPVISIVVGLHFFGMVPALGSNLYWWIGGAMCLLPLLTMTILPQNVWQPVVGIGCAVILWTSVICASF